ncbi:MAG: hypothetical protein GAK31_00086 [Stenotrophomonas maltophilia]|uniref:Uncharacterized protein n=1 Tax=Stenotrophomonas maltophilia TaxID=40324 RepID=A0A7V8JML1_STEMA|nr:MAG: hypothetical protein GAK31_00086 [Stenotrophomonas maltophilia]
MPCRLSSTVSMKQLDSWPPTLPALASVGVATVMYRLDNAQYASPTSCMRRVRPLSPCPPSFCIRYSAMVSQRSCGSSNTSRLASVAR